jgi:UDP-N-acetyl-D-mannosaminuronic acid transferase (WecB/TagA/CpsF family)
VLEMASIFTDTQLRFACKRNSQTFEDSCCIVCITCKLMNSTPQFLPGVNWMSTITTQHKMLSESVFFIT